MQWILNLTRNLYDRKDDIILGTNDIILGMYNVISGMYNVILGMYDIIKCLVVAHVQRSCIESS